MSAVISDIEQMRAAFSDWFAELFRQIFALIAFGLALAVIDWRMALGSVVLIPLVAWPVSKFGKRIRKSSERSRTRLADLSQILSETVSGNRVVKAFGMEDFEIRKFRDAARNLLRENMRWVRALAGTSPLMDLLGAVVIAMILLVARGEIKTGRLTLGLFGAFTYALFKAYEPIKRIGTVYQLFLQAAGTSAQIFAFIDMPEEKMEEPGAKVIRGFHSSIEFENASFSYGDGPLILKGIDLNVPAGTVLALVGSSGAGKTTLVNLLPRFYDMTDGRVTMDGIDYEASPCGPYASRSLSSRRKTFFLTTPSGTISATGVPTCRKKKLSPPHRRPWLMISSWRWRKAIRRSSVTAASAFPGASASAWLSLAPC